jgi:hypothetical protein
LAAAMDFMLGGLSGCCAGFFANTFDVSRTLIYFKADKLSAISHYQVMKTRQQLQGKRQKRLVHVVIN